MWRWNLCVSVCACCLLPFLWAPLRRIWHRRLYPLLPEMPSQEKARSRGFPAAPVFLPACREVKAPRTEASSPVSRRLWKRHLEKTAIDKRVIAASQVPEFSFQRLSYKGGLVKGVSALGIHKFNLGQLWGHLIWVERLFSCFWWQLLFHCSLQVTSNVHLEELYLWSARCGCNWVSDPISSPCWWKRSGIN